MTLAAVVAFGATEEDATYLAIDVSGGATAATWPVEWIGKVEDPPRQNQRAGVQDGEDRPAAREGRRALARRDGRADAQPSLRKSVAGDALPSPDRALARLKAKTVLEELGLPSEAQREVATRAGTDTFYYWGDADDEKKALEYCWFGPASMSSRRRICE